MLICAYSARWRSSPTGTDTFYTQHQFCNFQFGQDILLFSSCSTLGQSQNRIFGDNWKTFTCHCHMPFLPPNQQRQSNFHTLNHSVTACTLCFIKNVAVHLWSLCQWHKLQKPAPENWRRFLARLSYNLVPNFSGARFLSRIEHVLFRDRIWRPRDQNTDLWLISDQCCCWFRLL